MIQERDEHGLDQGGVEVKVLVRNGWVLSVCVFVCVFVCVCVCVWYTYAVLFGFNLG